MTTDSCLPRQIAQRRLSCENRQRIGGVTSHDDEFARMETAYAKHGGMLRSEEVVRHMREHWEQPISVLAKWIVARAMVTIDWRYELLVPMFQIDTRSQGLRPGCREIIAELRDVMDDWDIAHWFAAGNPWLDGAAPVDMLDPSWREALQAARVARFIVRG